MSGTVDRRARVGVAVSMVVFVAFAACDDQVNPTEMSPAMSVVEEFTPGGRAWYTRDRYSQIAQEAPGFAGLYEDEGQLVVLAQPGKASADEYRQAVLAMLQEGSEGPDELLDYLASQVASLRIEPAQYDHLQLHAWYQLIKRDVFGPAGVNYGAIGYRENAIKLRVNEQSGIQAARQLAGELGIPEDALLVSQQSAEGRSLQANLRQSVNPRIAGVQVGINTTDQGACSMGFTLDRSSSSSWYMVTASHCTSSMGSLDSDTLGQPNRSGTDLAVEVYDVPVFDYGDSSAVCPQLPWGFDCTWADVALFRFISSSYSHGRVAWPAAGGSVAYTTEVQIGGTTTPVASQSVTHVGRTSGRQSGTIDNICADVEIPRDRVWLICASVVENYPTGRGDSGGPTLRYLSVLLTRPWAAIGLHVAGDTAVDEGYFVKNSQWTSRIDDVLAGNYCMTIWCSPDPNASITSGPYTMPADLLCTWTASASSGVAPYTYSWSGVASGSGSALDAVVNNSGNLTVTVTDDIGNTDQSTRYIVVDNGAPEPPGCVE